MPTVLVLWTRKVLSLKLVFHAAASFCSDLSKWNVGKVTTATEAFKYATVCRSRMALVLAKGCTGMTARTLHTYASAMHHMMF